MSARFHASAPRPNVPIRPPGTNKLSMSRNVDLTATAHAADSDGACNTPGTFPEDTHTVRVLQDAEAVSKSSLAGIIALIAQFCWETAWKYKFSLFVRLWKSPKSTVLAVLFGTLTVFALPSLFSMFGFGISPLLTSAISTALTAVITFLATHAYYKPTPSSAFVVPLEHIAELPKERVREMVRIMNAEMSRLLDVMDPEESRGISLETARLAGLLGTIPPEGSTMGMGGATGQGGALVSSSPFASASFGVPPAGPYGGVFLPSSRGPWY